MRITAKVILDSLHPQTGVRLTTMELEYPRFIHAEFMTHRAFSRNASSSRAIPVERMLKMAKEDPAFFVHLGTNRPGMSAGEQIPPETRMKFLEEWVELGDIVASYVERWGRPIREGGYSLHKQVANRAMEPWHHIKVVCSSTEWANFFKLRCHPAAQPEMFRLADVMLTAMSKSVPEKRWHHFPYIQGVEWDMNSPSDADDDRFYPLAKCSAARCARVSYWNHDGTPPNVQRDLELFETLAGSDPKHLSPLEHVAYAMDQNDWTTRRGTSNFSSDWRQLRADYQ